MTSRPQVSNSHPSAYATYIQTRCQTQLSSQAAAEANRRLEVQKLRADEESKKRETAVHEAKLAAKSEAESATFRAETVRIEGARTFERFQEQVAFALLRVEDALADTLCGVGTGKDSGGGFSGCSGGVSVAEWMGWGLLMPSHELKTSQGGPVFGLGRHEPAWPTAAAAGAAGAAETADNHTPPYVANRRGHRNRDYGHPSYDDEDYAGAFSSSPARAGAGAAAGAGAPAGAAAVPRGRGNGEGAAAAGARGEAGGMFSFAVAAGGRGGGAAASDGYGGTAGETAAASAAAAAMASR